MSNTFFGHLRFSVITIFPCIQVVFALQKDIEVVRFQTELQQLAEFSNRPKTANLLVIAADHGEGTTGLSHALGEHPCIISVGEPFDTMQRWVSPDGDKALLRESGRPGSISTYSKLQEKIDQAMILKGQEPFNLSKNLHRKHPNLLGFFETVQEEVCAHAELPALCGTRCVLLHKVFPAYVTYNYSYVDDYFKSPKTMVIQVLRDEVEVISANTERFNMGKEAVAGLKSWNLFLNTKGSELRASKVWTTVEMSGHIFRSPHTYFDEMKKMLRKFYVPTDDDALKDIKTRIEREFREYEARKARLQSTSSDQVEFATELETSAEIESNNISQSADVNENEHATELATGRETNEVDPAIELATHTETKPSQSISSNQIEPASVSETETEVRSSNSPLSTVFNQIKPENELPKEAEIVASSTGQSTGASQMELATQLETKTEIDASNLNQSTGINQVEPAAEWFGQIEPTTELEAATKIETSNISQYTAISQIQSPTELAEETDIEASSTSQSTGTPKIEPAKRFEPVAEIESSNSSKEVTEVQTETEGKPSQELETLPVTELGTVTQQRFG